ncbi:hypothetical protein OROGR_029824 [Orobanche gracilis]
MSFKVVELMICPRVQSEAFAIRHPKFGLLRGLERMADKIRGIIEHGSRSNQILHEVGIIVQYYPEN